MLTSFISFCNANQECCNGIYKADKTQCNDLEMYCKGHVEQFSRAFEKFSRKMSYNYSRHLKNTWKSTNRLIRRKMSPISNSFECLNTHWISTYHPIWTQNILKDSKNILLHMNFGGSKIRSVHTLITFVIPWTFFDRWYISEVEYKNLFSSWHL